MSCGHEPDGPKDIDRCRVGATKSLDSVLDVVTSLEALDAAYGDLSNTIGSVDEAASWRSTRCAGWVIRDLVFHLLGDAQRGLVALATPADGPADRDAISYWIDAPGAPDPESRSIRALRSMASQASLRYLTDSYAETSTAVRWLARRTPPDATVATQGHVLRVEDLLSTLAVEAAIHHLDMIVELSRPGPSDAAMELVRTTLDGLLGRPAPIEWSTTEWTLVATGRMSPTAKHRDALGVDASRLPLLR
jgi:hypothetical protein